MNIKQDINMTRKPVELEQKYRLGEIKTTKKRVDELEEEKVIDTSLSSTSSNAVANYVITEALSTKINAVSGKTLTTNDFTDTYKDNVDNNTLARHTHTNKNVIDGISAADIINWNSQSSSVDYVTEFDTDGTWLWRKWHSGYVELFGFEQYTSMSIKTSSAGTYYGASPEITLPFTLTELYFASGQLGGSVSSGVYPYKIYTINSGTKLKTEFRAHASNASASCGIKYYIIGRYNTSS